MKACLASLALIGKFRDGRQQAAFRQRRPRYPLPEKLLQRRPQSQETQVGHLEEWRDGRPACDETERAQKGYRPPHCGKGCRPRQKLASFFGMKPRQDLHTIDRTRCLGIAGVDEADCIAPVQPPDDRDLAPAKRAAAVKPDGDLLHHDVCFVVLMSMANTSSAKNAKPSHLHRCSASIGYITAYLLDRRSLSPIQGTLRPQAPKYSTKAASKMETRDAA